MVAVTGPVDVPRVIGRFRIELADRKTHSAVQPYHSAKQMSVRDAEQFLKVCSDTAAALARRGIQNSLAELGDYRVRGACVLLASGRPLPDLPGILRSHALIHTAEGESFRTALREACKCCGLAVVGVKERDLAAEATETLKRSLEDLNSTVAGFGKVFGPPWRQDEKLSALAAWLVLKKST
jgi:hypothetical protein